MAENKSSISNASSYAEIGEYWDNHDLAEHWDETHEVEFRIGSPRSSVTYFAVEQSLAERLRAMANRQGVSPETLLNGWVQEHVGSDSSK